MSDLDIVLRITARREEAPDTVSLFFAPPPGLTYRPGDWLDIRFPVPEFPFGRTYSFASSRTEPDLRITFKRGVSPFKRRLECAATGETMLITQYGSNGFLLDRRFPAVCIAGGVGITPFRSMLKELVDTGTAVPVTLIDQNGTPDFPFMGELDDWARRCPWLTLWYRASATDGRLSQATVGRLLPDLAARQPLAYVAGPPGMVAQAATFLHGWGLPEDDIKTASFTAY
jgi:ferredoxin-NADP reductase